MSFFYLLSLVSCSEKTSEGEQDAVDSGETTDVTDSVQIPSLSLCSETRLETLPGEIVCTGQSILEGAAYAVAETRDSDGLTVSWPTRIINTDEQLAIVTPLLFSMYGAYQGSVTYRIFDKDQNELESIEASITISDSNENGASELLAFQDAFRQITGAENLQDELNVQKALLSLDVYLETYNRDVPLILINGEAHDVPIAMANQTADALRRFRDEMNNSGFSSSFESMTLDEITLAGAVFPGLAIESQNGILPIAYAGVVLAGFAVGYSVEIFNYAYDRIVGDNQASVLDDFCNDSLRVMSSNSCLALNEEEPLSDPLSDVFDVPTEPPVMSYDSTTLETYHQFSGVSNYTCTGGYVGPTEGESSLPEGVELAGKIDLMCEGGSMDGAGWTENRAIDIDGQVVYAYSDGSWSALSGYSFSQNMAEWYGSSGTRYQSYSWQ